MRLTGMILSSRIPAVICNPRLPDNPIVECNEAFVQLTGYAREEIIGRNCRFLGGEGSDPAVKQLIRDGIIRQQPVMVEILNYRKDGTPFRNAVMIAPIFDAEGKLDYFIGSQMDVSAEGDGMAPDRQRRAQARMETLSARQRQILLELTAGKRAKQIAYDLSLSERTVKMHKAALIAALGVNSSAEAIRIAVEAGY